ACCNAGRVGGRTTLTLCIGRIRLVDEAGLGGRDVDPVFQKALGLFDAPAFIRRGPGVQAALGALLDRVRARPVRMLGMVRVRLGMLGALAGDWRRLRPFLADDAQVEVLCDLDSALAPRLRVPVKPTTSDRVLRRALLQFMASTERFNQRWLGFLNAVDL